MASTGNINVYSAPAGSSGSTLQNATKVMEIKPAAINLYNQVGINSTPSASRQLTVSAGAADYAGYFTNTQAACSSYGVYIVGGGNSSDFTVRMQDRSGNDDCRRLGDI